MEVGKGWRSIAASIAVIVLGAAQAIVELIPMETQTQGYVLMGIGAAFAALRVVTTTPVGKSS